MKPRLVGVASVKGGVGKSTVCTNLAVAAALAGQRVLLLDGSLGRSNLDVMLGLRPQGHLGQLVTSEASALNLLTQGPAGTRLLLSGVAAHGLCRLDLARQQRLLDGLAPLAGEFDLALVDVGAGFGDDAMFFLSGVGQVVVVATPEPVGVRGAVETMELLRREAGARDFAVVVNLARNELHARKVFGRCMHGIRSTSARVRYLGWVPRNSLLERAAATQRVVVERFPDCRPSHEFHKMSAALVSDRSARGGGLELIAPALDEWTRPEPSPLPAANLAPSN